MIHSKTRTLLLAAICLGATLAAIGGEIRLTVGPQGDAQTLNEAIFKSRAVRRTNAVDTIHLQISGTQYLSSPIYLGADDSHLTIEGTGKGAALSGGRILTGWKKGAGNIWEVEVYQARNGAWFFHQLFVNGERRRRARTPNSGYFRMEGPSIQGNPATFKYRPGDLKKEWVDNPDVEVVGYINWEDFHMGLRGLDEASHTATLVGNGKGPSSENDARYFVENAPDALDAPGEWQLNSKTGLLRYWPMPGEDMTKAQVIAPLASNLLVAGGDITSKKAVEDITLRNLTFSYTEYPLGSAGYLDMQASYRIPGALLFTFAKNCVFEDCTFAHLGTYGLQLGRGVQNSKVRYCHFYDLGAGGIRIGDETWGSDRFYYSSGNEVTDCEIHQIGRFFAPATGILVMQSATNRLSHNHIYDTYSTGIGVGWTWGYSENPTRNNIIEFNHIHDLGQGVLSDLGGVYTLGVQPGTVVQNNLIHDVTCARYGAMGLYADEGSSQIVFQNNIVYRCQVCAFAQHFGRNNIVRNNIFAFAKDSQFNRVREDEFHAFDFVNNIVYYDAGILVGGALGNYKYKCDRNVYFDARPNSKPNIEGMPLEQWQARGQDRNSIVADPRFVDVQHDDFRLRPDSPAFKLGFKPIDLSTVGPRKRTAALRSTAADSK
jgi:hypothetical protein